MRRMSGMSIAPAWIRSIPGKKAGGKSIMFGFRIVEELQKLDKDITREQLAYHQKE